MTESTKKVIEVGKSKKHTFSFKVDFFHFLVGKLIFDSTSAELSLLRSDAFAVILPRQRPVLVSAHAQNFLS